MSPFKGQGANQALLDAEKLAELLSTVRELSTPVGEETPPYTEDMRIEVKTQSKRRKYIKPPTLSEALAQFEEYMMNRVKSKVAGSRKAVSFLHSPAVLEGYSSQFSTAMEVEEAIVTLLDEKKVGSWTGETLDEDILAITKEVIAKRAATTTTTEKDLLTGSSTLAKFLE